MALKYIFYIQELLNKNQPIKLKGLTVGMSYHLAGCCSPIQGDKIVGIVTAGLGVSIHTVDCNTLDSYSDSPERWLDISWESDNENEGIHTSRIKIVLTNKAGSLGKVTTAIANNNGNISNIHFTTRKSEKNILKNVKDIRDNNHLNNIMAALRLLSEISSLERVKG